jgi:peroxiredoxin
MYATSGTGDQARVGDAFPPLELTATSGQLVTIPDPAGNFVHLQLRRFAGCPICNRHLRSIVACHDEIRSHGIREVVLIAPDGRVAALKYGQHAYDQWTVDELLDHAHPVPA